jgi:pimeloyl-ACP methyl ester carboxylesterase
VSTDWRIAGVVNGIAYRELGRNRDIVLVHGLGMSSEYFVRFARALADRGWSPIAPDLRGPATPQEHARMLAAWADALGIRDAVWVGHSLGCNAVAHLPVRKKVFIGPLWTRRNPARLLPLLFIDIYRERLALLFHVARAYVRYGVFQWFATFRRYRDDLHRDPPDGRMIAGDRDPLPDRAYIPNLRFVRGAHACHFTSPRETALLATEPALDDVAEHQHDQSDEQRDHGHDPLPGAARDAE